MVNSSMGEEGLWFSRLSLQRIIHKHDRDERDCFKIRQ